MELRGWLGLRWVLMLTASITWACSDGDDCADTAAQGRWRLDQPGASAGGSANVANAGAPVRGGYTGVTCAR